MQTSIHCQQLEISSCHFGVRAQESRRDSSSVCPAQVQGRIHDDWWPLQQNRFAEICEQRGLGKRKVKGQRAVMSGE